MEDGCEVRYGSIKFSVVSILQTLNRHYSKLITLIDYETCNGFLLSIKPSYSKWNSLKCIYKNTKNSIQQVNWHLFIFPNYFRQLRP